MIGSGGVNIAAKTNIITTTNFLLLLKYLESIKPTLAKRLSNTGNWKLIPKAKIYLMINDKYSFTLASNCIGKVPEMAVVSKVRKNFIANGITR